MKIPMFLQCSCRTLLLSVLLIFSLPFLSLAADFLDDATYVDKEESVEVYDPLEPVNRVIFSFNDTVYEWVLDPVATGYSKVVPSDIRGLIGNFFL